MRGFQVLFIIVMFIMYHTNTFQFNNKEIVRQTNTPEMFGWFSQQLVETYQVSVGTLPPITNIIVALKGFEPLFPPEMGASCTARRKGHFCGVGWTLTNNLSYERINLMLSTPFVLLLQIYGNIFILPNIFLVGQTGLEPITSRFG